MPSGPRQLLQDRFAQLSSDLESLFDDARDHTRREFAEQLNQSVRRLRIAPDADALCATLSDAATRFASGALLFRVDGQVARNSRIEVPLADAPALVAAADHQDPIVALATAAEISAPLVDLLGHDSSARAHIFPVAVRGGVPAILYTWGAVQGPAIELLSQVAAAIWTALPVPKAAVAELITITSATPVAMLPAAPAPKPAVWTELPPAEQRVHLRAQRFARVQAADMRLRHAAEVQSGREHRNLYDALQEPIDSARGAFRAQFFNCPSMVDYLDLELTRTLAHDNPELLGQSYPGPLV